MQRGGGRPPPQKVIPPPVRPSHSSISSSANKGARNEAGSNVFERASTARSTLGGATPSPSNTDKKTTQQAGGNTATFNSGAGRYPSPTVATTSFSSAASTASATASNASAHTVAAAKAEVSSAAAAASEPTTAFVFNIPDFADEESMMKRFREFGRIKGGARGVSITRSGSQRNAFIEYETHGGLQAAIKSSRVKINGHLYPLRVVTARSDTLRQRSKKKGGAGDAANAAAASSSSGSSSSTTMTIRPAPRSSSRFKLVADHADASDGPTPAARAAAEAAVAAADPSCTSLHRVASQRARRSGGATISACDAAALACWEEAGCSSTRS